MLKIKLFMASLLLVSATTTIACPLRTENGGSKVWRPVMKGEPIRVGGNDLTSQVERDAMSEINAAIGNEAAYVSSITRDITATVDGELRSLHDICAEVESFMEEAATKEALNVKKEGAKNMSNADIARAKKVIAQI